MAVPSSSTPSLLTLSHLKDRAGRPILLLHTAHLPPLTAPPTSIAPDIQPTFEHLPPAGGLTLIVCNAGQIHLHGTTTRAGVRAVRTAYESDQVVPPSLRPRLEQILLLHVSVLTRAQIYLSSFSMSHAEYSKIKYCDLLADLEAALGVDSTLLGLEKVDFDYDETMRYWVGRQDERNPVKPPDPADPLLDLANVSTDWSSDALTTEIREDDNDSSNFVQP